MKKLLLTALVAFSYAATAQVLQSDNFDAYNVGNVGTVTDGTVEGQGGWNTFIGSEGSDNTDNANFLIVASEEGEGNVFRMTGSSTPAGVRVMWKDGLDDAWDTRTTGNDIIEVEFDYFTGTATTSNNEFRVYIYSDEEEPKVLAGIGIAKNLVVSGNDFQNVVRGFLHWSSTPGTGTYSIGLGESAAAPLTLPVDTWVRLGFSFNKTTGEVIWKTSLGLEGAFNGTPDFPMVTAGIDPLEVDFLGFAGANNTVASSADFDNYIVSATATDNLLSTKSNFASVNFSVYPNPATEIVNVDSGNMLIESVQITDLHGRIINSINVNSANTVQVNVSNLTTGIYFLTVKTDQGIGTSKIIKK